MSPEKIFKKIKESLKNSRNRKKWLGILFILVFMLNAAVNQDILASKNSGYGYGYSSGSYGYGYQYSSAVPSAVTGFSCSGASSSSVTCSWTAVSTATDSTSLDNFASYTIYYSTSSPASSSNTLGATVTSSSTTTATISGLSSSTTYYFAIYANDDNTNSSTAATASSATNAVSSSGGGGVASTVGSEGTTTTTTTVVTGKTSREVTIVSGGPTTVVPSQPTTVNEAAESEASTQYQTITGQTASTEAEMKAVYFMAYGTNDESKNMTQRERGGVMQDYTNVYGILPANDTDWNDVDKILTSHRPTVRSLNAERSALVDFGKIYKRMPDYKNINDEWALYYIAYRIRPQKRNLDSERFSLMVLKSVYGEYPDTGYEWSLMRAIAYTGAKR